MYTAGELAKKLGVSARTVRFYDEKDLLNPCGYSEAGYRLYNEESAERLQKILMLKLIPAYPTVFLPQHVWWEYFW